jgi:hypothetical protein
VYERQSKDHFTYGELFYGISKGHNFAKSKISLDKFTQNIRIIPIDSDVAKHYGDIRAKLSKQGNKYILRALIDNVNTNIGVQNIIIHQNFLFLLVVYRPSQNP